MTTYASRGDDTAYTPVDTAYTPVDTAVSGPRALYVAGAELALPRGHVLGRAADRVHALRPRDLRGY